MKKVPQDLDDKLLDYLDGKLSPADQQTVETILRHEPEVASRLEELRSFNSLMRQVKPELPSKNFTSQVMSKLDQKPVRNGISIRNGILLLIGVLVSIGIATALISSGAFDNTTTVIDLNTINLPKKYINNPLPSIPLDGKLLVNIIIVLNLALVFVVLDRAILKPYFQRRMESSH